MSRWTPVKRSEFVRRIRKLGFEGPYSGARHRFLVSGNHRLTVPSNAEFSVPQLRLLLREVGGVIGQNVNQEEWEALETQTTVRLPLGYTITWLFDLQVTVSSGG